MAKSRMNYNFKLNISIQNKKRDNNKDFNYVL